MAKEIRFTVPGEPKAKGRPRFSTYNGHVVTHTPKTTVEYENLVRLYYTSQAGDKRLEGPLSASIVAYFPIPQSTSKKKRQEMIDMKIMHTKKPDADNIAKSVLDSISGIAYDDDKQVCALSVTKVYGEQPRVEVLLREIDLT